MMRQAMAPRLAIKTFLNMGVIAHGSRAVPRLVEHLGVVPGASVESPSTVPSY